MQDSTLIFVPYQDTDNFYEDGILTREFAMLYMIEKMGFKNVINIKKPRTFLDKRRYEEKEFYFPNGTIEKSVKDICDEATTIQYLPLFKIQQVLKRRLWWGSGYKETIRLLEKEKISNHAIVYSDNPFAEPLLDYLKRELSCYIYFDVMDNFAIHPSLNDNEHKAALTGYTRIMDYADSVSANSDQTCEYIARNTGRDVTLVKNGVFKTSEIGKNIGLLPEIERIRKEKSKYKKCVGYIGKLGLRLDADLIDAITRECPDVLFVFVGPMLKGQINRKLEVLFEERDNVLRLQGIPSAYVYSTLDEFDVLMIPHSVGKGENGGDPLKLYQYLTRNKPIITTPILGVSEFENYIIISDDEKEWVQQINNNNIAKTDIPETFLWETRFEPIAGEIREWQKLYL